MLAEQLRKGGRWLMDDPRRRPVYDALNAAVQSRLATIKTGPAKGMHFKGGDTAAYVLGLSEPSVQRLLVAHLRPGDVYFDVGAHAGFLALLGSRVVGPSGVVHCFEPVLANMRTLTRNLQANSLTNVSTHRVALGDFDGKTRMDVGTRAITAHIDADGGGEEVDVVQLDSLSLPAPHVIKVDVEGAESMVLAGATSLLERHRPVLVIEIHGDQEQPVRNALRGVGYPEPLIIRDGGMPHLIATCRRPSPSGRGIDIAGLPGRLSGGREVSP